MVPKLCDKGINKDFTGFPELGHIGYHITIINTEVSNGPILAKRINFNTDSGRIIINKHCSRRQERRGRFGPDHRHRRG
jgi:hypothetical protein